MTRTKTKAPALWQRPFDGSTLVLIAMASGVILWLAMSPGFYYMAGPFLVGGLWALLATIVFIRLVIAEAGCRLTGRRIHWNGLRGTLALVTFVTVACALKLPLHASFAFARPALDRAMAQDVAADEFSPLSRCTYGPYSMRQQAHRRDPDHRDRVYFTLATESEAGFVYSESGIEDLSYNSGNKGHLVGNWYWMAED